MEDDHYQKKKDQLKRFIDWNKKIFSDPTPAIAWNFKDDGRGNKEEFVYFFGSWFYHKETNDEDDSNLIAQQNDMLREQNDKLKDLIMSLKRKSMPRVNKNRWLTFDDEDSEWEED
jgi:hypothetical protein